MSDYNQEQNERDTELINRSCVAVEILVGKVHSWIASEMRALMPLVQQQSFGTAGMLAKELGEIEQLLRSINLTVSDEALKRFTERREEIERGLYDDPLTSLQFLIDATAGLERVMRQLLNIRKRMSGYVSESEDSKPGKSTDEQNGSGWKIDHE